MHVVQCWQVVCGALKLAFANKAAVQGQQLVPK